MYTLREVCYDSEFYIYCQCSAVCVYRRSICLTELTFNRLNISEIAASTRPMFEEMKDIGNEEN